jgi:hypothetical protein
LAWGKSSGLPRVFIGFPLENIENHLQMLGFPVFFESLQEGYTLRLPMMRKNDPIFRAGI